MLPQRRSVLCFSLNKAGKPLLTRVGSACFVYFCLSKAGQQLVDRVRRAPRGMSDLRFALAKAGQHMMDHIRRAPRTMSVFWLWPGKGKPAVGGPLATLAKRMSVLALPRQDSCFWRTSQPGPGAYPFYVWPRQGRPALAYLPGTRI